MIAVGFVLSIMFRFIIFKNADNHSYFFDVLISVFTTIIIWEGNVRIDTWLNNKIPWLENAKKRIIVHFLVATSYSVALLFISIFGYHKMICGSSTYLLQQTQMSFLVSVFIVFTIISIEIGYQFFKNWKHSTIEMEKYKTESINAQLQNLKSQVNPHFLFNNLSVLSSLVYKDQEKAVEFIQELSKVYRYVLDNKNTELVSLHEEMKFIEHYIFLLKIRFEENIQFVINIPEADRKKSIPPMCLQILVENVIKHNEISSTKPLCISIFTENSQLIIQNPIQPRTDVEKSNKTGLQNIKSRYSFFTNTSIQILHDNKLFKVSLPLITAI